MQQSENISNMSSSAFYGIKNLVDIINETQNRIPLKLQAKTIVAQKTQAKTRAAQEIQDRKFKHVDASKLEGRKPRREQGERIKINVSGKLFESYKRTLVCKKGSIFSKDSVLEYYDSKRKEFVFYRNSRAFGAMLVYMQCGVLTKPDKMDLEYFLQELKFYGFNEAAKKIYDHDIFIEPEIPRTESCKELGLGTYVYEVLENSHTNVASKMFAAISAGIIFLSIIVYSMSTHPSMTSESEILLNKIETFCNIWFTTELLLRFTLCPDKLKFWKQFMNWVDLISVIPFYFDIIFDRNDGIVALAMLRILRVTRILRIFKLSRYSTAINLILLTIKASVAELTILLLFISMEVILFSALIYNCEHDLTDSSNKFKSIPHTFWLVIVTITTVGYGDMYPITCAGKIVTSVLSVTGIILIALPIPIVVTNFQIVYDQLVLKKDEYEFHMEFKSEQYDVQDTDPLSPDSLEPNSTPLLEATSSCLT